MLYPLPQELLKVRGRKSSPPSMLDSEEDEGEEEASASHYKLSLEEVDDLSKAIHTTLEI